jgi:hypothetical protein
LKYKSTIINGFQESFFEDRLENQTNQHFSVWEQFLFPFPVSDFELRISNFPSPVSCFEFRNFVI